MGSTGFQFENKWLNLLLATAFNLCATGLAFLIGHFGFSEANIVVVYLLSVLVTSCVTRGYLYGILASVLAILSFNFFFSQPVYSFDVEDINYLFTFLVMLLAAVITSTLTSRLIAMQELSARRERETNILYQISSTLSKTSGMREVAAASARCLSSFLEMPVRAVLPRYEKQALLLSYDEHGAFSSRPLSHGEELKRTLEQSHVVPIQAGQETVCCFCLPQGTNLPSAQQALLDSILLQISTAMERELLNREKENAKSEIRQERLKSQLLRAISHDLRTPLAAIAGSAEILAQELDDPGQIETARSIYEDVSWLTRLVENILNLTRIQEDRLSLHIQPEAVEEVISSAVHRVAKYAPDKVIRIKIPDEVLFVPMDSRLMEQVLINLMDNAVKHTPPDAEIRLSVWKEGKRAWFEVSDNGPGVAEADLPNLFDMFYMAQEAPSDARRGIGLGLAICKAIVTSHGGEICAENMQEGGACFRFCLNL